MNRNEIITELKRRYLRNEPVTEKEIVESDPQFFYAVLQEFGSWHKLEKEVGLLQRHLKEREKYFLYLMMKERRERFGVEALRHKNIEEEVKEKIAEGFGTVKKLTKDILDGWNQDRVLYEAHTYFITGGTPESLKKDRSLLYENIYKYFADEEHFYKEYEKRFLIQPLDEVKEQPVQEKVEESLEVSETQDKFVGFDIDTLVAIGYMTKEEADEIRTAAAKPIEEVIEFVSKLDPNVTDQQLAKENRLMWLAIKHKFGSLDAARRKITEQVQGKMA
jgi:hypothetical protein